ncbi:LptF/LptG family permease [Wenyingzhuangia aestuarii]|uniref:LptF/LptG family permease n=1 Tax=Wenyingzhuangia aestuarii TaxID=1647582 RepID=UPI00143AEADD|nr:LptF/LptG family permease [Wenyingzhuangia aestuarii]NJB81789.1 lipopolysaccharide export system permease protein [Wenyingzhuangia aestuarii]
MKTLDKYLIKNFLVPFTASFLIVMFVLVMQLLWLVFDDIAGKGIDISIIFKFLWYTCLLVTAQALPISVLLSSIMTMGNLGENYELAAIKSSGVSFYRFLRPLIVTAGIISLINFLMINYTFPYASLKQKNLLLNIKKTQPTLALVAGSFNDEIPGYSIKFAEKYGEENNLLKDVIIIDTKGLKEDQTVITAKRGKITTEEGSKYMTLILEDGYYFEDHTADKKKKEDKLRMPASMAKFEKYTVNIDISDLTSSDLEEEKYKHHYTMKNLVQLQNSSDSLKVSYDKYLDIKFKTMQSSIGTESLSDSITPGIKELKPNILDNFELQSQLSILTQSLSSVTNKIRNVKAYKDYYKRKRKDLNNHDYQYHLILTSSFSCLLLFFVGASLGSIIRKGGFGLPMIVAIIIYVTYHFTNTFGKNLAEESSLSAFLGGWLGTLIMLPLAIIFTISASKDMGFIKFGVILLPFKKLFNRLKKRDE